METRSRMNEALENEFQPQVPDNNAQDETQKSEPKRTMVVFLTANQIIIAMIVLTWTWNIEFSDLSLKLVTQTGHLSWSLKWLMKVILSLPLLFKLVDEIWVCILTDVDVGNAENDLSSTIDFFNLVVSEVSVKIQFWSSFIRDLNGYPNHKNLLMMKYE